jgi:hypothetical protein
MSTEYSKALEDSLEKMEAEADVLDVDSEGWEEEVPHHVGRCVRVRVCVCVH